VKKFLLLFCFLPNILFAEVVINEIMYDLPGSDQGREWIEIYNSSTSATNLEGFNIETTGNHRPFVLVSGSFVLPPGGMAAVVQDAEAFRIDQPYFSGTLFESAFSLNNTSGQITLKNKDTIIDRVSYKSTLGAKGNGDSLQKFGGSLLWSFPTPGQINKLNQIYETAPATSEPPKKEVSSPKLSPKIVVVEPEKDPEMKKEPISIDALLDEREATSTFVGNNLQENGSNLKWFVMLAGLLVVSILPIIFSPRKKDEDEIKIIIEE